MEIHDKIKALREDKDKKQKEIADILKIDQSYYAKYENGKHPIPMHHIKTLCQYYNISADYLLGLPEGLNWPRRPREEDKLTNSNHSTKYDFDMLTVIIAVSFSYIH